MAAQLPCADCGTTLSGERTPYPDVGMLCDDDLGKRGVPKLSDEPAKQDFYTHEIRTRLEAVKKAGK
jgi:hypothetical protein